MGYLADEIKNAASELNILISEISSVDSTKIRKQLAQKFSNEAEYPTRLSWQNLKNYQSIYKQDGWRLIQNYVGNREVILFVEHEKEENMWSIPSGEGLIAILYESTGFPFCVTSQEADYIICFDDHDCLIGAGEATEWICKLKHD